MPDQGKVGEAKAAPLFKYWTGGAGLIRWAAAASPYNALVTQLRSENVPEKYIHGLAAKYYRAVFHHWPGNGHNKTTR